MTDFVTWTPLQKILIVQKGDQVTKSIIVVKMHYKKISFCLLGLPEYQTFWSTITWLLIRPTLFYTRVFLFRISLGWWWEDGFSSVGAQTDAIELALAGTQD